MLRPTSHHLIIILSLTGLTLLGLLSLLTQQLYRRYRNRRQARETTTAEANLGPLDEEIELAEGEESFEGVKTKNKKRRIIKTVEGSEAQGYLLDLDDGNRKFAKEQGKTKKASTQWKNHTMKLHSYFLYRNHSTAHLPNTPATFHKMPYPLSSIPGLRDRLCRKHASKTARKIEATENVTQGRTEDHQDKEKKVDKGKKLISNGNGLAMTEEEWQEVRRIEIELKEKARKNAGSESREAESAREKKIYVEREVAAEATQPDG
ncbi:MAG: hypothetical protein Q9185_006989 [Variospora sp. 1 TL-2023]